MVLVAALAVVVLGTIGFTRPSGGGYAWWEAMFKSVQLFGFAGGDLDGSEPLSLNIARVLGPLMVGYAAVRGLLALSRDQLRLLGFRLFRRNHVVVAGLGDVGFRLAAELNELGARVIGIDLDPTGPSIEGCRERGISVVFGDATDPDVLHAACVDRAAHLVVAPGLDAVSIDVIAAAGVVTGARTGGPLRILAHIEDRVLWTAMQARALSHRRGAQTAVELFNLYEAAGRLLVSDHFPFRADEIDSGRTPQVLIVSDEPIGEILVVNVARIWRIVRPGARSRVRVDFAGPGSAAASERLIARYPALEDLCELEPWEVDLGSPALRDDDRVRDASATYVALGDEAAGAAAALLLAGASRHARDVVLVINDQRLGAAQLAAGDERIGRIATFGILSRTLTPDFLTGGLTEVMARAMHDSYVSDQLAKGETAETLPHLRPWAQLDEEIKDANRDFAASIPAKMAAVGRIVVPVGLAEIENGAGFFDADEVELLAVAEHERWAQQKLLSGWRYGPKRDDIAKLHPSLVPYKQLSESEKDKDRVAVRELPEMLAQAGFAIERVTGRG